MTEKEHVNIQIEQDRMARQTKKEQRLSYDQKTEDTLSNLSEMASDDVHYCSMALAAIYQEIRRQGKP